MTGPGDDGGDPACWAHLLEEDLVVADLGPLLAASGDGVHWTLEPDGDLNANLVRLDPGRSIGEHGNDEVDVLVVVLAGRGHLVVGTQTVTLAAHILTLVPKGERRSVHAGPDGLSYLTVHRRRGGLAVNPR